MPNKSMDRYLVVPSGAVMTDGYSAQLAKGQIGLFDLSKIGKKGAKAVTNINGNYKFNKYELRLGVEDKTARTLSNKSAKTISFAMADVTRAWVGRPHVTEQKFDAWYIGWDGVNDGTSFKFMPGNNFQLDLVLWGKVAGMIPGVKDGKYLVKVPYGIESHLEDGCCEGCENINCEEEPCAIHTLELVKTLNNWPMPSGETLSKWLDIYPVLSTPDNGDTKEEYKLYELSYCGAGNPGEIGKVQAQYPNLEIEFDSMTGKYVTLVKKGESSYTAPANYTTSLPDIIPGCDGCPSGYDEIEGGYVYVAEISQADAATSVDIEKDFKEDALGITEDQGPEGTPTNPYGVVDGSIVYYDAPTNGGNIQVVFVTETELTTTDLETITGDGTIVTVATFVGEKGTVCHSSATTTVSWVETDHVCTASEQDYQIFIADDCTGDKEDELNEYYPDLVITKGDTTNCITKYTTTVITNMVCPPSCPSSSILKKMYESEAPLRFGISGYWTPVGSEDYGIDQKCGIFIKAKPVILNATGECLIDDLPFVASSIRVKPAGGYITNKFLNFGIMNKPFSTFQVESAVDMDNLGGNMRGFEKQGKLYFQNETYKKDMIARSLLGLENQLEGLTQYNTYAFEVNVSKHSQGVGGFYNTSLIYHMVVPTGQSTNVEAMHNTIAAAAGVPVENL